MQNLIGLHGQRYAAVPPQEFSMRMKEHWTGSLGLCSSGPLEKLWAIMAKTFNEAINDAAEGIEAPWRILQPPTGSGKTRGACLFAAMQAQRNEAGNGLPVGSIIVTRLIKDADELATEINNHAGRAVAVAHHSEARQSAEALFNHDTLVITHQAYLSAQGQLRSSREASWERLATWKGGKRLLTIVDEALANVVESAQVTEADIAQVLAYVTRDMEQAYPTEYFALTLLKRMIGAYAQACEEGAITAQHGVWDGAISGSREAPLVNFAPLRAALKGLPFDRLGVGMQDAGARLWIARKVDKTLDQAQALYDQWAYYAKVGPKHSFNSSALSVPWDAPGPVVLDATARADFLWDLFEDKAQIVPTPSHVRDYSNVTLHVARASGVGKRTMTKNFKTRFPRLLRDLEGRLGPERSVFVCTHLDSAPFAKTFEPPFANFSIGHWGAVDGSNEWANYDTAVIFGLSYRDQVGLNNTFFAIQGYQGDEWLAQPEWKTHRDVRRVMRQRQLSVSIIQAIGRIRCRRVIDEHGRSPPADIFIVLPKDREGDDVLSDIVTDMPGLKVKEWDFQMDGPKVRKPRKGSHHEALLAYMTACLPGSTPMTKIARELGMSPHARRSLQETLRNTAHATTQALAAMGVGYKGGGVGRGAKSYLVKHQPV
jgi:hypothetical protein